MAKALVGVGLGLSLLATAWVLHAVLVSALLVASAYAAPPKGGPSWEQLTPQQQQILAPIQSEWASLDATRKRKWLGITKRYPSMTEKEQARLQERMREWVKLTPEERQAARARYREFKSMPPDDRRTVRRKWEDYQRERQEEAQKAEAEKAEAARLAEEEARRGAETAQSAPEAGPLGPAPGAAGLRPQ